MPVMASSMTQQAKVSHIYTKPVSYIVTLTVSDTSGNTDTDTYMVTVNVAINRAPILMET